MRRILLRRMFRETLRVSNMGCYTFSVTLLVLMPPVKMKNDDEWRLESEYEIQLTFCRVVLVRLTFSS